MALVDVVLLPRLGLTVIEEEDVVLVGDDVTEVLAPALPLLHPLRELPEMVWCR